MSEDSEPDETALLEERARLLAQPVQEWEIPRGEAHVVFRLADARFALSACAIRRIQPLDALVRVPCVPPFVAGAISVQEQVWVILDIRERFGLPQAASAPTLALLIGAPDRQAGIAVDAVEGIRRLQLDELPPPPQGIPGAVAQTVRGVTPDRVLVLEPAALLEDPALNVHEEV